MIGRAIALTFCVLVGTLSLVGLASAGRATAVTKTAHTAANADAGGTKASGQTGLASVYGFAGDKSAGGKTANGERVRATEMSAAHRTFAFGTRVRVTNLRNGLSAVVRINDRGPFVRGRIIDLTPAAAKAIGFSAHREGLARVALAVEKD